MPAFQKFNQTAADFMNGVHDLGTATVKVLLTDVAPDPSAHVKADITEIAAGNGYAAGGAAMTGVAVTGSGGVAKMSGSTVVFTASGGSIAQFRYAVLYNASAASGNLLGWCDSGGEVVVTDGNGVSVVPADATDILQIS